MKNDVPLGIPLADVVHYADGYVVTQQYGKKKVQSHI
jgi:hypothetical protein